VECARFHQSLIQARWGTGIWTDGDITLAWPEAAAPSASLPTRRSSGDAHPRKTAVSGPRKPNSRGRLTPCWREQDSNPRSRATVAAPLFCHSAALPATLAVRALFVLRSGWHWEPMAAQSDCPA
jgi:hypothetical protein